ncbi:hypothetical protein FRB90_009853 [Tulasnella sp. 427]|nr:hypothetical protein FRB90_009853 [Tulasnella sp. 427]
MSSNIKSATIYEASLKVHTSPSISRHLRPHHPPFWVERQFVGRVIAPPYTFYDDPVRGTLIHARRSRTDALPLTRVPGASLVPDNCKGPWFLITPTIAQQLKAVEDDMVDAFTRIQLLGSQATIEDMTLAGYLRQVFDHFLGWLAKKSKYEHAYASDVPGAFHNPMSLDSIDEEHMSNALSNKASGQSYRTGAWITGTVRPQIMSDVGTDVRQSQGKRPRDPETVPSTSTVSIPANPTEWTNRPMPQLSEQGLIDDSAKRLRMITPQIVSRPTQSLQVTRKRKEAKQPKISGIRACDERQCVLATSSSSNADRDPGEEVDVRSDRNDHSDLGEWETYVFIQGHFVRLTTSVDREGQNTLAKDALLAGLLAERGTVDE